jgi:hypothetical protein
MSRRDSSDSSPAATADATARVMCEAERRRADRIGWRARELVPAGPQRPAKQTDADMMVLLNARRISGRDQASAWRASAAFPCAVQLRLVKEADARKEVSQRHKRTDS